jgi:hypothetical protein
LSAEKPCDPAIRTEFVLSPRQPAASMPLSASALSMNVPTRFPHHGRSFNMQFASSHSADPVEELRLRRWARENYVAVEFRDQTWHAVVLDEMRRKDQEEVAVESYAEVARRIVPLVPEPGRGLRGPHIDPVRSNVLVRVPTVE